MVIGLGAIRPGTAAGRSELRGMGQGVSDILPRTEEILMAVRPKTMFEPGRNLDTIAQAAA